MTSYYQLCRPININSFPPYQFLRDKILLKKKMVVEMLFEQFFEFELRGPETPNLTCIPATGYFHDKTKINKANLRVNC